MKDIRELKIDDLEQVFKTWKEPKFRAKQVYEWLWKKGAEDFESMTNLSKPLRIKLQENFTFKKIQIEDALHSSDKSVKYSFRLPDGEVVEGVLIPSGNRTTACISSQVGCSLNCTFCATGTLKMKRNLTVAEIFDQIFLINQESEQIFEHKLTNIVYMGMGEPLLNYKNVFQSVDIITSEQSLHFSPKRITISTSGVTKMIRKMADDQVKVELAISLHSADNQTRSSFMDINPVNPLEELAESLKYFYEKTKTRVTLEYILFQNINDSLEDAEKLANFARIIPTKINIIEYNPVDTSSFVASENERAERFIRILENKKLIVNLRRSRGKDVNGACGQLALKKQ